MNSIVEKLAQYDEFKNICPKIDEDLNKKGYSIFQVLSNDDLINIMIEKEYIYEDQINPISLSQYELNNLLEFQDKTTILVLQHNIYFNYAWYNKVENFFDDYNKLLIEIKNLSSNPKTTKLDFYSKYFGKKDKESLKNFKLDISTLFGIILLLIFGFITYFIIVPGFFTIGIYLFVGFYKLAIKSVIWDKSLFHHIFIICLILCLIWYGKLIFNDQYSRLIFARKNYNKNNSFLYQLKCIEDIINEIEDLDVSNNKLNFNFSSFENYNKLTIKLSKLTLKLNQKLQNLNSNQINKKEIISFATQNFNIVIKNWINILSNIQNQLQVLNSEAKTDNQKVFVKTTDALNQNINITLNQLETLKI